ncbi:hypothetical protein Tco_0351240 [Tanacetum coccineum]
MFLFVIPLCFMSFNVIISYMGKTIYEAYNQVSTIGIRAGCILLYVKDYKGLKSTSWKLVMIYGRQKESRFKGAADVTCGFDFDVVTWKSSFVDTADVIDMGKTIYEAYNQVSTNIEPTKGPKGKESQSGSSKGTKSQSKSFGKSVQSEEPEFEVANSEMPQDQEENLGNDDVEPKENVASKRDWFTKPTQPQEPTDPD